MDAGGAAKNEAVDCVAERLACARFQGEDAAHAPVLRLLRQAAQLVLAGGRAVHGLPVIFLTLYTS